MSNTAAPRQTKTPAGLGSGTLVRRKEAADILACTLSTLDKMIKLGRLDVVYLTPRAPRIRLESIRNLKSAPHV